MTSTANPALVNNPSAVNITSGQVPPIKRASSLSIILPVHGGDSNVVVHHLSNSTHSCKMLQAKALKPPWIMAGVEDWYGIVSMRMIHAVPVKSYSYSGKVLHGVIAPSQVNPLDHRSIKLYFALPHRQLAVDCCMDFKDPIWPANHVFRNLPGGIHSLRWLQQLAAPCIQVSAAILDP